MTALDTPTLTAAYGEPDGVHDEMKSADGSVRAVWRELAERMDRLGGAGLGRRWAQGQRMIQDNGVTYNVYGDPRGTDRPWQLDPVPLVLGAEEWRGIEAGLVQRARLLNAVCADLYGPQTLLHEDRLPAELILGHPGFLRPCRHLPVRDGRYLTFYAADLARSPDGRWWVLSDRAQAPSGAGYALENRLVVSRSLPGVFRDCRVQRHAQFFARWRQTLRAMSPRVGENPRIVLLTPGPYNETYFEHAYLARYLGFNLVQGDDLTVRDNKVFLRTLGGLRRVDVVVRRLDDGFCDPLELRDESRIGVPGLVQAAWAGNVAIANALGTGVLETPGLMPFYPGLCRHLLGEEEKLSGIATWWCGQPKERDYVIEHLPELVIKPAYPGAPATGLGGVHIDAIFGDTLSPTQREEIAGLIHERPEAFAAQESVNISTAPVWHGGRLVPRHVMLRAYVAATDDGAGYAVMPGGLTRVSRSADSRVTSMQRGGGSKDTWVISDTPVSDFTLLAAGNGSPVPTAVTHDSFDLPSRVADNLYWLGRYTERGDGLARLLRAIAARLADAEGSDAGPELPALLETLDAVTLDAEARKKREKSKEPPPPAEARIRAAMSDPAVAFGLAPTLENARRLASVARDRVSLDIWRILSQLGRDHGLPEDDLGDALGVLDRVVTSLAAFTGLGTESMLRNQEWRFLDMGRRLERVAQGVAFVRCLVVRPRPGEGMVLEGLLEVMASAMSYRQRYLAVPAASPTLDMLLLDETNPRSVAYQLVQLDEHLEKLPRPGLPDGRRGEDQRLLLDMLTTLRLADAARLAAADDGEARDALSYLLMNLASQVPALSDAIARQFLSHNAPSTPLGGMFAPPALIDRPTEDDAAPAEEADAV